MAYIKTLKDNQLIGGTDQQDVYPVSSTQALYSQDAAGNVRMKKDSPLEPEPLEDRLKEHEDDAAELHRKSEKLVPHLTNDKAGITVEITGAVNTMALSGSAELTSFGDEDAVVIPIDEMSAKGLTVTANQVSYPVEGTESSDGKAWQGSFIIPDVVETYVAKFQCTYNDVQKEATTTTYVNLRKFFGFVPDYVAESGILDYLINNLGVITTSHFSNSVSCTVEIPNNETGFKNVYFAVPDNMTITSIKQPDSLNAPLAFEFVRTSLRAIDDTSYTYKIYKSTDKIDSANRKRLTIA